MKIVAPLSNSDCYEKLIDSGADELFCGFLPFEWLNKYNTILPINRREFMYKCNICTYSSMEKLSRMVKYYGYPVKIAFNSHYYIPEQYNILLEIIERLMNIGFDTFIIADPALIFYLREHHIDCKIHVSGEFGNIHELSLSFFKDYKIDRFVFPRKTNIEDMQEAISFACNTLEFEAFILNEMCIYSGAFCNSLHCDELVTVCRLPYEIKKARTNRFTEKEKELRIAERIRNNSIQNQTMVSEQTYTLGETGCGLCQILELKKAGVKYLKIVGRGTDLTNIVKDVKAVKQLIELCQQDISDKQFVKNVKEKVLTKCSERCYYRKGL